MTTTLSKSFLNSLVLASAIAASSANAAVILASDFTGVAKSGTTADSFSWDTTTGINTPATSLSFVIPGTSTALGFHDVSANEIDVDNNMTNGGWETSINIALDGSTSSISLTSLDLGLRLASGNGGDNNTGSKQGQVALELVGSTSGSLGTVDLGGNQSYPSVEYTRTLDLSSLPALNPSETYTLILTATGSGFGHHKSLQDFSLEGNVTAIPEPTAALLGALGMLALLRRRR